ncbi:class I SAM-dependent methyltransferase [Stygiolobus caldivivus]|uniref:Methyltransferase n=1 Tax=Stygiolobus caldivivus TaxID=2824673 RepID=A0A8D5ZJD2_9CREN|nr:class I SAM-dependent methyltransferase [Stygiolobus caldivivus]BCU71459.1 methyltransferase [Stygiolobus caldivivus]
MEIFTDPDGYAKWYRIHDKVYESERRLVSSFKLNNCLDVGSGPAIFHETISGNKVSLDLSIFMLTSIPENEDRVQGDALNLPFRENAFECVFSSVTVCFIDDPKRFVKELKRVTKKRIVICYIPRDSPFGKYYEELGKKGHKYYSQAHFISREDLYHALQSEDMKINLVRSTLFQMEEKIDEVNDTDSGSFVCVEAVKQ